MLTLRLILILYLINKFAPLMSNQNYPIIYDANCDELLLFTPIKFTSQGLNCYLKYTYNHLKYASEIVPHNTGHFMQLLEHGKISHQDHQYMIAVLRLFRQKLSHAPYLSAVELERMTSLIPTLLEHCLTQTSKSLRKSNRKLKQLTLQLVEQGISKTLWDCHDAESMIQQTLRIGNNLEQLLKQQFLEDPDDLNDLIHIFIDRLIYIINLAGPELPFSFFHKLKSELQQASWMQLAELEDLIDTKLQKIERVLLINQIKAQTVNLPI